MPSMLLLDLVLSTNLKSLYIRVSTGTEQDWQKSTVILARPLRLSRSLGRHILFERSPHAAATGVAAGSSAISSQVGLCRARQ
jgi:uncharacterized protein (DUF2062 family)